jgi:hypothetical protein
MTKLRSAGNEAVRLYHIYVCMSFAHDRTFTEKYTSSEGWASLKQLSHTSFTARCAVTSSGHAGFARTDRTDENVPT